MIDKKTFAIGVLSLTAVILLVANILAPRQAHATYETIQDNDFAMLTADAPGGSDAVYILDKRTGEMAAFIVDPNRRTLVVQDAKPVQSMFDKLVKP